MTAEPAVTAASRSSSRLSLPAHDRSHGLPSWEFQDQQGRGFSLQVAGERGQRARAYALAQRVYARLGYVEDEQGWNCSSFDADPSAFTALVSADGGSDAATISLYFDSPRGMPCDEVYGDLLVDLRRQGRRLVEVSRLAIDEPFAQSKQLLVALFQGISIYARRVARFHDLIIEINPRHVSFYERTLGFVTIGEERPCPRVRGAPAVLMRLDLAHQVRLTESMEDPQVRAHTRLLYACFLPLADEPPVAELLARQHQPMSPEDARYFGLATAEGVRT
jgi:hypothetical protein